MSDFLCQPLELHLTLAAERLPTLLAAADVPQSIDDALRLSSRAVESPTIDSYDYAELVRMLELATKSLR